jgi:hypothetical protein
MVLSLSPGVTAKRREGRGTPDSGERENGPPKTNVTRVSDLSLRGAGGTTGYARAGLY